MNWFFVPRVLIPTGIVFGVLGCAFQLYEGPRRSENAVARITLYGESNAQDGYDRCRLRITKIDDRSTGTMPVKLNLRRRDILPGVHRLNVQVRRDVTWSPPGCKNLPAARMTEEPSQTRESSLWREIWQSVPRSKSYYLCGSLTHAFEAGKKYLIDVRAPGLVLEEDAPQVTGNGENRRVLSTAPLTTKTASGAC
jgi:hypothetical protein